ncbi:DUF2785 domain-containing protein [Bacillus sp. Marseille-Q1617]|uniref:DUF2785 domain-containing protein n=1 Tax=Bacillus sp. Marseille-Q1617 TaxID=2736887 RepID=UPI00158D2817|nr:DUF2785 domain-containing protein [Bacillus sp. Marseille-Q1617]
MNLQLHKTALKDNDLKIVLTQIKSGEKNWLEVDRLSIVQAMFAHIGSTDPELRDQLIYTSFYRMIIEDNLIEPENLKKLLFKSINELLHKGIGESGTDSVFTRTFTTLLIALILYRDNEESFLTQEDIDQVKHELIHYINEEIDLRGYVPYKGWAHSIAHVADTFDELVKSPKISQELYSEILHPLWKKMLVSESTYIHQEDERMVTPIIEMLDRGLSEQEVITQVQALPAELKAQKEHLDEEKYWFLVFNSKAFLKSFYMKLNEYSKFSSLQESIQQCLREI